MQQEKKNKEVLQQNENLQQKISYQTMVTDVLQKEVKKLKGSVLGSKVRYEILHSTWNYSDIIFRTLHHTDQEKTYPWTAKREMRCTL